MTTYGAYNANLPCKNSACKSHGRPHPNCQCYPGRFAEGGKVDHHCSEMREHKKNCSYYAEGGNVEAPDHQHDVSCYLSHGAHSILDLQDVHPEKALDHYHGAIRKGHKNLESEIESVFSEGKYVDQDHSKFIKRIDEWLEKGGIDHNIQEEIYAQNSPQNFAEGGKVGKNEREGILNNHPITEFYPEQNLMLQTAKGRISGYLNGLRPQKNQPKLAFDLDPDTKQQKKSYDRALGIAVHPMSILRKIKKGVLDKEDLTHFQSMYPELGEKLNQKLVERITKDQLNGKKPKYKVRQSMSLFLGVPLNAEMLPQNIAAAQSVFKTPTAQPQQNGPAPQKKTSALTKSSQAYLTANSAAASRQQKQ